VWDSGKPPDDVRVVVLGAGFVGRAVAHALRSRWATTELVDPVVDGVLMSRTAAAADLLRSCVDGPGTVAVVNCCGLLRGTDEELASANSAWPTWLAGELAGRGIRLVHIGSASEYGDPGSADPVPESRPARPSGIYGETKWAGSAAVLAARADGLDAVVARGFNLVAHDVPGVSPLRQFADDVDALPPDGGEVELWWPDTRRDFVLLDDLAEAVARLAVAEAVPEIVNVCSGVGVAFGDIVTSMAERQGKRVEIRSLERPGIPAVIGDPTLLGRCTGLRPEMSARLIAETVLG
jgi:NDP-hexose 4-ketoreductase